MRRRTFWGCGVGRKWNCVMHKRTKKPDSEWQYRKDAFPEDNDIHIQWFKVCWAIWILIEATETNKIVVPEGLNLLARLFHLNVFCGKRMNLENL